MHSAAQSDAMAAAADYIRARLREEMRARNISQRALSAKMTAATGELWRESRMSKLLNGEIAFFVDDMVTLAQQVGVSLVELVREKGREYVADLTPTELQVLNAVRDHPDRVPAILQLLSPPRPSKSVQRPLPPLRSHRRLGNSR